LPPDDIHSGSSEEIFSSRGDWRFGAGLFDKLRRRKRNVDGEVLAGLDFGSFGFRDWGRTKDFGGTRLHRLHHVFGNENVTAAM
jgi:hypothetical protein